MYHNFSPYQLEEKVSRIPEKLKGVKGKLENQEKLHDQMIQLQPQRDQANQAHTELKKIRCVVCFTTVNFSYACRSA